MQYLYDETGRRYLDLFAGIVTVSVGHCHPTVVKRVQEQVATLQHEIDHLDGVLAVDRTHGLDPFCLREEWNRIHAPSGRYGPPEPRDESYASQMYDPSEAG